MKEEKEDRLFLCYEADCQLTYCDNDGNIDEVFCYSPSNPQTEKEAIEYLLTEQIREDGQIYRSLSEIIPMIFGLCFDVMEDNRTSGLPVETDDFEQNEDYIIACMRKVITDFRVQLKNEQKEFEKEFLE